MEVDMTACAGGVLIAMMDQSRVFNLFCWDVSAGTLTSLGSESLLLYTAPVPYADSILLAGFSLDAENSVDLRMIKKGDEWILRIRDNCIAFDPKRWMEIHHPKDPASNIGIRMVYGMAKDVQHVNAMQLNNLTIRV